MEFFEEDCEEILQTLVAVKVHYKLNAQQIELTKRIFDYYPDLKRHYKNLLK
jgi:hypothetical protein